MPSAEATFLEDIRAEPNNSAARLVYADWLEDRGDPRSELIRLREELNTLSPLEPRYWDAKIEFRRHRRKTDPTWLATMRYDLTYHPMFTRLAESRAARWRLVEEFIELWHEPLTEKSGCSEEEIKATEERLQIRLPEALKEWHRLAGKRTNIWSHQDHLNSLSELRMHEEHDALLFRWENQGCELWGIKREHLHLADPPVTELYASENSTTSHSSVSVLAIQTLLLESMWGPFAANNDGGHSPQIDQLLKACVTRAELPDAYWVIKPVNFYEGDEKFTVECLGDGFTYLACRTQDAYDQLPEDIRDTFVQYERY